MSERRVVGGQRAAAAQLGPGAARAPRGAAPHQAHAERELVAQAVVAVRGVVVGGRIRRARPRRQQARQLAPHARVQLAPRAAQRAHHQRHAEHRRAAALPRQEVRVRPRLLPDYKK